MAHVWMWVWVFVWGVDAGADADVDAVLICRRLMERSVPSVKVISNLWISIYCTL